MSASSLLITGYFFVVISSMADATSPIIGKLSYALELSPPELIFIKNSFSFFLITGFLLIKQKFRICLSPLAVIQGLLLLGQELLLYYSLQFMQASTATIIFYTYPILVAILSIFLFQEKPSRIFFTALIMAFAGVAVMCGFSNETAPVSLQGIVMNLLGSLFCACFTLLGQKTTGKADPMQLMLTFSLIGIIACGMLSPHAVRSLVGSYTMQQIMLGLGAGICNNLLGIVTFLKAISYIGASKTSLGCTLEPVIGILLAVFLLHEPITCAVIIGAAMVVLSIILTLPGCEGQLENCLLYFYKLIYPGRR